MRTTKAQISLRICAVYQRLCCSLPKLCNASSFCNQNFKPHASFCNWAGQFESDLVGNSRRHVFSWWGSLDAILGVLCSFSCVVLDTPGNVLDTPGNVLDTPGNVVRGNQNYANEVLAGASGHELQTVDRMSTNEPPRDKTNKVSVRPGKTQISLGIRGCQDWSESLLGAQPHCWFCHEAAQIYYHVIY